MNQAPLPRLSSRRGLASVDLLHEGVPDHLRPALARWAKRQLGSVPDETGDDLRAFINDKIDRQNRMIDVIARAQVAVPRTTGESWFFDDVALLIEDLGVDQAHRADDILDLVDMHLQLLGGGAEQLVEILESGGSAWTVATDPVPHLERRVPDEEHQVYAAATTPADDASAQLREAWGKVYGRTPDPSDAWDHAIKAVEILLHPIVSPANDKATLGSMLAALESKPGKWTLTLTSSSKTVGPVEALIGMLRLIWPNPDRHGSGAGTSRVPTQAEAEQVVRLAVFVVGWLRTGALQPVAPAAGAAGSP